MGRPQCQVFLCTDGAFDYRSPGASTPQWYCEEHAEELGLSANGKSFDDGVKRRNLADVESAVACTLEKAEMFVESTHPLANRQPTQTKESAIAKRRILCVENKQIYENFDAAATFANVKTATLYSALSSNGRAGGFTFHYEGKDQTLTPLAAPPKQNSLPLSKPLPAIVAPQIVPSKARAEEFAPLAHLERKTPNGLFAALGSLLDGCTSVKAQNLEFTVGTHRISIASLEISIAPA